MFILESSRKLQDTALLKQIKDLKISSKKNKKPIDIVGLFRYKYI